jgi:membrane protein implicated in regulation of membrane protease activity
MEAYHLWLIAGLVLAASEMLLGDFTLLCIGVATAGTALPASLGWSLEACVGWLAATLLVIFVTLRPTMRKWAMKSSPNIASNMNSLVGKITTVTVEGDAPWANTGGDHWRLECESELEDGQKVKVLAVEGSRLRVEPEI